MAFGQQTEELVWIRRRSSLHFKKQWRHLARNRRKLRIQEMGQGGRRDVLTAAVTTRVKDHLLQRTLSAKRL